MIAAHAVTWQAGLSKKPQQLGTASTSLQQALLHSNPVKFPLGSCTAFIAPSHAQQSQGQARGTLSLLCQQCMVCCLLFVAVIIVVNKSFTSPKSCWLPESLWQLAGQGCVNGSNLLSSNMMACSSTRYSSLAELARNRLLI